MPVAAGPPHRVPHRHQHGRHRRRGRRHLWRRRQRRGPARRLGRAWRHLRLGARSGRCGGPARPRLRRHGRAGAQEHRATSPGIPRRNGRQPCLDARERRPTAPRQAVDRGVALCQYERRSGAGIFRRRHGRGDHHRALAHPLALRDRPQFELHLQGPGSRREAGRARAGRPLCPRRRGAQGGRPRTHYRAADRRAKPERISGPTASTARSKMCSSSRTRSRSASPALSSRHCKPPPCASTGCGDKAP